MTRVVLVHAMRESIGPTETSFSAHWPEAELVHLLDSSLSTDRGPTDTVTEEIATRITALASYGQMIGADAVLFTCSAFGPAIDAATALLHPIPVHKPNTAMIAEAASTDERIGLLGTFQATLDSMVTEFPPRTDVTVAFCDGALAALTGHDATGHDDIVADTAQVHLSDCGVLALAQFSLARAAPAVESATGKRVLTTPDSAVLALRNEVEGVGTVPETP